MIQICTLTRAKKIHRLECFRSTLTFSRPQKSSTTTARMGLPSSRCAADHKMLVVEILLLRLCRMRLIMKQNVYLAVSNQFCIKMIAYRRAHPCC